MGKKESYDIFRRLNIKIHGYEIPQSDDCVLCGTEDGDTMCGYCRSSIGLLQVEFPDTLKDIHDELYSMGDDRRAGFIEQMYTPELMGDLIKRYRFANKLTQSAFANILGVSQQMVSQVESGERPIPVTWLKYIKYKQAI